MKELYKTLGVNENDTQSEIKKAYRTLAKKYHPDKCSTPECEEKFKEINAANEVLSNKEQRAQYDRVGDSVFGQGGFHQYSHQHQNVDLNDILNQMFGGGGFHQQREPNLDRIVRVRVPLEKAVNGGKMTIDGNTITIPKLVGQGMKLRVKDAGETYNGKTGDLYVQLVVQGDNNFELQGNRIHTTLTLNIKEAIFGCSKEVNFYGDKIKLKIPKDIKYGQQLRVQGKGLRNDNLIVHILYELPHSSNVKESDLSFIH
jgi:curved DNA-binding protein